MKKSEGKNSQNICETGIKKTVGVVQILIFLVCMYKSQDFVQSQENFAQLHKFETVIIRHSEALLSWLFVVPF